MEKIAFKMKLKPGMREEYERRHAALWPEMVSLLSENGISDYSIFLDEQTDTLFAVQCLTKGSSQDLGGNELVQRWWKYMADLMDTNPDFSPVTIPLIPMFHLD
ncbi:MAG: L-rhamnose mutarotase [Sphingobacterium sp.]|uniref:L-rhamnose mutarotase n=1 Tax=Sphingobacterium sp. JB170 TaxID=1434842 RepID=UPI00097F08DF|nr:L-rhamnose mutarotase [Sphingobacterium sp. JB170]SJN34388.1 L-rhamnose mutarotase [Sphingobacterium sp. JB170]